MPDRDEFKEHLEEKGPEERKIFEGFLDERVVETVQKLRRKHHFDEVGAVIREGKESIILLAFKGDDPRILKVHKIETSRFRHMTEYIRDDPRFEKVKLGDKRSLVRAWTKKEFSNLRRAHGAGVRCPEPHAFLNNVLVLEFVGTDRPAPTLKDTELEEPEETLNEIVEEYGKLYGAGLVHADLSEYNVLYHDGHPWLIDFAQAVTKSHPKAGEFFERDMDNLVRYFGKRYGVQKQKEAITSEVKD